MTTNLWSSVGVAVQSALATAITITGITKANPAVVTYTGTDPSNGDYVILDISGMSQLDETIVRVANVNGVGNTFEAEGFDSTLYDTFSSGTGQVITFGTTLSIVRGLQGSGGDFAEIDDTTIHDQVRTIIPGVANPVNYNLECRWDPADAGLVALVAASRAKAKRAVKFSFANGAKMLFYGYVGATGLATGNAQDIAVTPVELKGGAKATFYAS